MAITTNSEYITSKLSRFNLSENDIDLILAENPLLDGPLDVMNCKLAIYSSISSILPLADVKESEYAITWKIDALKLWYQGLCNELGKPNVLDVGNSAAVKPKVRNRSNYW
jgi:hypothetical protein